MKISVIFVRFGLREMEDDAISFAVGGARTRDMAFRIVDNWGNPESLTALWNRVSREEDRAGADLVLLLNSDCWVPAGWDEAIQSAFIVEPRLGACGPSANTGPQTAWPEVGQPTMRATGWPDRPSLDQCATRARRYCGDRIDDGEPFGFCYAARVNALRDLDFFVPELRVGYTLYGSEQSLSRRLRDARWRVGIVRSTYVWHLGEASGRAGQVCGVVDVEAERRRGRELFFGHE